MYSVQTRKRYEELYKAAMLKMAALFGAPAPREKKNASPPKR